MKTGKKVSLIVQVRMRSSRLPGKVWMEIVGKPMIWHVVERLKVIKHADELILAISDTKENDLLEQFAKENGLLCYRGSEADVLARYYEAAKKFQCQIVVRICSDNPLIDPAMIDEVIEAYLNSTVDYASNILSDPFPVGFAVEVFAMEALEKAFREAQEPDEREHVTPYIYFHPELFKCQPVATAHPKFRLTVDTQEDLALIREIYMRLYEPGKIIALEKVKLLLENHQSLLEINKDIIQKKIRDRL